MYTYVMGKLMYSHMFKGVPLDNRNAAGHHKLMDQVKEDLEVDVSILMEGAAPQKLLDKNSKDALSKVKKIC